MGHSDRKSKQSYETQLLIPFYQSVTQLSPQCHLWGPEGQQETGERTSCYFSCLQVETLEVLP